jgi:hypothetical protein
VSLLRWHWLRFGNLLEGAGAEIAGQRRKSGMQHRHFPRVSIVLVFLLLALEGCQGRFQRTLSDPAGIATAAPAHASRPKFAVAACAAADPQARARARSWRGHPPILIEQHCDQPTATIRRSIRLNRDHRPSSPDITSAARPSLAHKIGMARLFSNCVGNQTDRLELQLY